MGWNAESCIDFYYGEYKKNKLLGKKNIVRLSIYPSQIEGLGFNLYNNGLSTTTNAFEISFDDISNIYIDTIANEKGIFVEYKSKSIVLNKKSIIVFLGMEDNQKWLELLKKSQNEYIEKKKEKQQLELEMKAKQDKLAVEKENNSAKFYEDCYNFHIKNGTPTYPLFSEKNKIALIYIDDSSSLNFLKIDGYEKEENIGMIKYENIHYFEKAGNVSYATTIHGEYSSFGGSMTGGDFSKLATAGGGLLFGFMGMALGAALTYTPAEQKSAETSFKIDSDITKIDDRSVILNFYSEAKKQYVDIELPQDIYNFLQTYLPEKKYSIVDELEKKTVIRQSTDMIENGDLLKVSTTANLTIGTNDGQQTCKLSIEEFKSKVEKLKIMKDAGLLSNEKFEEEQAKLLDMI